MDLKDIKFILDLEFFTHGKIQSPDFYFALRELSVVAVDKPMEWNFHFKIAPVPLENSKVLSTLKFQRNRTRLPFNVDTTLPYYYENQVPELIAGIVKEYGDFDPEKSFFAYKGGYYDSLLLSRMNLQSVNLEQTIACPKFDDLVGGSYEYSNIARQYDCGRHCYQQTEDYKRRFGSTYHCSLSECSVYRHYLRSYIEQRQHHQQ